MILLKTFFWPRYFASIEKNWLCVLFIFFSLTQQNFSIHADIYIFSDVMSCLSIRDYFFRTLLTILNTRKKCDNVNFLCASLSLVAAVFPTATASGIWINISCCKWIRAWQSASVFCVNISQARSQLIEEKKFLLSLQPHGNMILASDANNNEIACISKIFKNSHIMAIFICIVNISWSLLIALQLVQLS